MEERIKTRLRLKPLGIGDRVMVEAEYFDDITAPKEMRYSTLLGKEFVEGIVKSITSLSYTITFEDNTTSVVTKSKVKQVDDNQGDNTSDVKFKSESSQASYAAHSGKRNNGPNNMPEAQQAHSIITSSFVTESKVRNVDVNHDDTSDVKFKIESSEVSADSGHDTIPKAHPVTPLPYAPISSSFETPVLQGEKVPRKVTTRASYSITKTSSLTTGQIYLSKQDDFMEASTSAITAQSSVPTDTDTPALQTHINACKRKKRAVSGKKTESQQTQSNVKSILSENEHVYLKDALCHCDDMISDDEVDLVLLPPDNVEGDTDTECGNDADLHGFDLEQIEEVSGTIEISTTRGVTRTKRPNIKDRKAYKPPKGFRQQVGKEVDKVMSILANDEDNDNKIDSLVNSADVLDELRNWERTEEEHTNSGLEWQNVMSVENIRNLEHLNHLCTGKMPVEVFELLFNQEMKQHIITETRRYAHVNQNDTSFDMSEYDLKCFIGTLFYSGYHCLPQQSMYWERSIDTNTEMVYQAISKNRFKQIKRFLHLADNSTIDLTDKFAKVRPLYDLTNKSLQQFGFWHKDYSIDEQMIPYFGMHSAKQTMRIKAVRFGYKNFVLASADGYPYLIIPYAGAKGIGGTPGKDLTIRVVANMVLQSIDGIGNLTFDNWYTSAKLMSLLAALGVPTISTVRADRVGNAPVLNTKDIERKERGFFSYAFDDSMGLHCVKWYDNSVVTLLSNCTGPFPLGAVDRFSRKEKKKVSVPRPNLIKFYNNAMGGVDLLDAAVATYRIKIKGKKWWWVHFTNTMGVLMGAAWKMFRATNPDADQTLLYFVRSVTQAYLQVEKVSTAPTPNYWKAKKKVDDNTRLVGRSHWPSLIDQQRRCQLPGCKSKVRTICKSCDVALCIKDDHFQKYHTTK